MTQNVIKSKSFQFAISIIKICERLKKSNEFVLSRQLLKSGTAIGALVREAEHAESKADFVHKMSIAQKEANETLYWLELLSATSLIEKSTFEESYSKAVELIKLTTSIIKTSKLNR